MFWWLNLPSWNSIYLFNVIVIVIILILIIILIIY